MNPKASTRIPKTLHASPPSPVGRRRRRQRDRNLSTYGLGLSMRPREGKSRNALCILGSWGPHLKKALGVGVQALRSVPFYPRASEISSASSCRYVLSSSRQALQESCHDNFCKLWSHKRMRVQGHGLFMWSRKVPTPLYPPGTSLPEGFLKSRNSLCRSRPARPKLINRASWRP